MRHRQSLAFRAAMCAYATGAELIVRGVLQPCWALQPHRRAELGDRLGRAGGPGPDAAPRVLVHGVSAGEVAAAAPLVDRLVRGLGAEVLLTTGTRDGAAIAVRVAAGRPSVRCRFLPWDRPGAVRRWLAAEGVDAAAIVETELWPGLFEACASLDVPLVLVSARLYPRDVPRYALLRPFWRAALRSARAILAQDETEAAAFRRIGAPAARVRVGGSLKYDAAWSAGLPSGPAGPPLVLAASTHDGDERVVLRAIADLRGRGLECRVVIAPRHVDRAPEVRARAARLGLRVALPHDTDVRAAEVHVLDRMGRLRDVYPQASIVIVGGTFARHGGHNVIEPAASGRACIVGPHTEHIRAAVRALDARGGVVRIGSTRGAAADALAAELWRLIGHRDECAAIGARARAVCEQARGAAVVAAAEIAAALRARERRQCA